ncbi:hypothetical protein V6N13_054663 [Hibiscus sabdariffa]
MSTADQSPLESEAKAVVDRGWWNGYDFSNNISERCKWHGISCNPAGSITKIILSDTFDFEVLSILILVAVSLVGISHLR